MDSATHILVVDDEPINTRLLEAVFEPSGATVVSVSSGRECIDLLDDFMPDIILLDVMMPGMDGYETTLRIRSRESTRLTPVLLVTSLGDTDDRIAGIQAGCDDFIAKPFDRRELLAIVESCLGRREAWLRANHREREESHRLRQEMKQARLTQKRLFPTSLPTLDGIEIWGTNLSSDVVSGDYYDVVETGAGGPVVLAIADVSGKGLPAALVMSNLQAGLRSQVRDGMPTPSEMLSRLNHLLLASTAPEMFVTMFIATYWREERRLLCARAGHEHPLLMHHGMIQPLMEGGPVLGLIPDARFELFSIDLDEDDVLVLYTDGVVDASGTGEDNYGVARLAGAIGRGHGQSAESAGRHILSDITGFVNGSPQSDDITLLLIRATTPIAAARV